MFECSIGLGKIYSLYLYILYYGIVSCLCDSILSFGCHDNEYKVGFLGIKSMLTEHSLIKRIYKNLGYIIFSIIYYYCFKWKFHRKTIIDNINNYNNSKLSFELIYEEDILNGNESEAQKHLIIVGIIFGVFLELGDVAYEFGFHDFDLWIFNIVFILLFMKKFYKIEIYRHQKFALIINFIINLGLLILIIVIPVSDNSLDITRNMFNNGIFCIPFIALYILNSSLISYSVVRSKLLMDFNYILPYKIIFMTGCFALLVISILLTITSLFDCDKEKNNNCNVDRNNKYYYDHPSIYFSDLKDIYNDKKIYHLFAEIIIIPIFSFLSYLKFLLKILIIYYLNPFYTLVGENVYYILNIIIKLISINLSYDTDETIKVILSYFIEVLSGIFYLIYLEVIELRFCGFDKNLKRRIQERGQKEILDKVFGEIDEGEESDFNSNENRDSLMKLEMSKF